MIRAILPLGLLFAVACAEPEDTAVPFTQGTTTAEGECEVLVDQPLDVADVSELGYSAEQLLRDLEKIQVNNLDWNAGGSDGATMLIAYTGGQVTYYERSLSGNATGDLVDACVTGLEFPVTLDFATGQGEFDEVFEVTMRSLRREEATFSFKVDPSTLVGTWTPTDAGIDDSVYTSTELLFEGVSREIGSDGSIIFLGTNADGSVEKTTVATYVRPPNV